MNQKGFVAVFERDLTKANIAIRDDWAEGAMDGWSRRIALKTPLDLGAVR